MKVTCDNCGAVYRIPEEKLTKDVSRATCKKCGNKIVIRKPSGSLSDHSIGSNYAFDDDEDDSIVNHEERTVIATVPELQRFDATPPLSVPGGSDHEHDLAEDFADAPSASARQAEPAPALSSPSDTAAIARPSGVPIPSQSRLDVGAAPLVLVVVGLIGTLLFIRDLNTWVWSNSASTAVGFNLALYAQVAVLMALLDLRKGRSPRPPLVFGVPAAVCVMVFLLLLMFQGKKEMAFLNVGTEVVATLGQDNSADLMGGIEYEEVLVRDETTGELKKVKRRKPRLPKASDSTRPGLQDGGTAEARLPTGGPTIDPLAKELMVGGERRATGPKSDIESQRVALHDTGLSHSKVSGMINADDGVKRCLATHSSGISGALIFEVSVMPSGKVNNAQFEKSSAYRESEFERCLTNRVERMSFPSYTGEGAELVAHKFLF